MPDTRRFKIVNLRETSPRIRYIYVLCFNVYSQTSILCKYISFVSYEITNGFRLFCFGGKRRRPSVEAFESIERTNYYIIMYSVFFAYKREKTTPPYTDSGQGKSDVVSLEIFECI